MRKLYFNKKKIPSYWWDFEGDNKIIVESDNNKYPIVARFKYDPKGGRKATKEELFVFGISVKNLRVGAAEKAIKKAEKYIVKLVSGRIVPIAC